VIALAAAFLGRGVYTLCDMPLDVLPDLSAPNVTTTAEVYELNSAIFAVADIVLDNEETAERG
jgi:hypothetical protein